MIPENTVGIIEIPEFTVYVIDEDNLLSIDLEVPEYEFRALYVMNKGMSNEQMAKMAAKTICGWLDEAEIKMFEEVIWAFIFDRKLGEL